MNIRYLLPSLLAAAVVAGLAGCGQTGPLYRPNDKSALEKYDPSNDYQLKRQQQEAKAADDAQPTSGARTTPLAQDTAPAADDMMMAAPKPAAPAPAPAHKSTPVAHPAQAAPATALPAETALPTTTPVSSLPAPATQATSPWSGIQWTPYRAEGGTQ